MWSSMKFGSVVQDEMLLKNISYLEIRRLLYWMKWKPFMQFWSRILWGTILWNYTEFGQVVQKKMSYKDSSYLEHWWPFWSAEPNDLCNCGRRYQEEQFCENTFNLDQWFRRRYVLKTSFIWIHGVPFVQWSKSICAISVKSIKRYISVKLFWIWTSGSGGDVV